MKHRLRKLTSALISIVMIFGVLTVAPFTVSASTSGNWSWPTSVHSIKSDWPNYSSGSYHGGTDFSVALNSPVYSTCDGEVVAVTTLTTSYGKHIKIKATVNGSVVYIRYCHLNSFAVSVGDKVQSGQLIAYSGSTGNSTGPHLHYEVRNSNDTYGSSSSPNLNPRNYLPGTSYTFETNGNNPTGVVDIITGKTGEVTVRGWAFDVDDINAQLNIHVYIGGQAGDSNAEGIGWITANTYRPDVDNVYGCGGYHGYDVTIQTTKTGTQAVYVYAINVGSGENVLIGSETVNIAADTQKPSIEKTYLSKITSNSYRVCVIPKDNVGIKKVSVATWTQSDQSDLIWHDAENNGYGTYYIDLQRSDYSKTFNWLYFNHIYVYDYAGNSAFIANNMDYRVKSDTGKTINDGEYRIVTSVDESKALDIAGGKNSNGTNIQIYSNINDPNQTFDIQYINDGFYTVFSHSAKKSIDVEGDTYQSGTNVAIYDYHEGANQQWIIKPTDDGYYTIVARSNGLALDLANAKNEDGANVQVHTVNNSAAQKWKLRRVIKSEMVNVSNLTIDKNTLTLNPEIQVIVDDNTLVLNKDYKVEVNGDIESGTGTVTVTGIGDYCDSVSKSFEINQYEIGDVNNDGSVNITDTTAIQKHLASINTLDENALIRADVNSDGKVDIKDATLIQQYSAGLIDKF